VSASPYAERKRIMVLRINDYLGSGGLFNPEMAKHDVVRDMLIECRDLLAARTQEARQPLIEPCGACGSTRIAFRDPLTGEPPTRICFKCGVNRPLLPVLTNEQAIAAEAWDAAWELASPKGDSNDNIRLLMHTQWERARDQYLTTLISGVKA
jgi:hypothetical protein